jgi:hypothetical protein
LQVYPTNQAAGLHRPVKSDRPAWEPYEAELRGENVSWLRRNPGRPSRSGFQRTARTCDSFAKRTLQRGNVCAGPLTENVPLTPPSDSPGCVPPTKTR